MINNLLHPSYNMGMTFFTLRMLTYAISTIYIIYVCMYIYIYIYIYIILIARVRVQYGKIFYEHAKYFHEPKASENVA